MSDGTRNTRQSSRNTRKADVVVLSTWPREGWIAALWDSDQLTPTERLVGLCYARHAFESDEAWVTWPRLSRMTGIRSRSTLSAAVKGLVAAGWLVKLSEAAPGRSPEYRLVIPAAAYRHQYDANEELVEAADLAAYRDRQAAT